MPAGETPTVATPTTTPTSVAAACVGDCNGDGVVTVAEIITGVNIALGSFAIDRCQAIDANGNSAVSINELIAAVNNLLRGCPQG
jgi:hypothetical protein